MNAAPDLARVHPTLIDTVDVASFIVRIPLMAARDHRPSFHGVRVPVRCGKLVLALLTLANAVLIALTLLNHNHRQAAAQATRKSRSSVPPH